MKLKTKELVAGKKGVHIFTQIRPAYTTASMVCVQMRSHVHLDTPLESAWCGKQGDPVQIFGLVVTDINQGIKKKQRKLVLHLGHYLVLSKQDHENSFKFLNEMDNIVLICANKTLDNIKMYYQRVLI